MANIFDWWNLGKDSAANLKSLGGPENSAKFKNLISNDWAQRQISKIPKNIPFVGGKEVWNPLRGFVVQDAVKGGLKSGPTPLVRQAARRIGLPASVGFGAYDLTNAAIDKFGWEDDLENAGGSLFNLVNSAKNKLGNFDYQQSVNNLRDSIFDTDTIAKIASQYPSDPQTNPIGTYGVGVQSDAKHQAASARASDKFNDMLNFTPIPRPIHGLLSDSISLAGGAGVEAIGSLKDYAMSGFKDKNYLTAAKEDMISDWKGTFGTDYGTSTADIMNNVYKQNNYAPKPNSNIFNSNMQLNPTANPQGPAGFTQPITQPVTQPVTQPITQPTTPAYQPPVQPTVQRRVNNVSPGWGNSRRAGTSKNYGVTGRRVTGGR